MLNSIQPCKMYTQISVWKVCYVYFQYVFSICLVCQLHIWTFRTIETFSFIWGTFLTVGSSWIHFDGFITHWALKCLVRLDVVVEDSFSCKHFITNVTLDLLFSMTSSMILQFLRSGEGLATNMTNKGHTCRKGCWNNTEYLKKTFLIMKNDLMKVNILLR